MDTLETYIKMCEEAEEIQALRREENHKDTGKWKAGDFWTTVFDVDRGKVFIVCDFRDAWADEPHYLHHPIECIWLPRQDQLQEMIFKNIGAIVMAKELAKFASCLPKVEFPIDLYGKTYAGRHYIMLSMEQLWLAFVMKEKFVKVWDGKTWRE